MLDLAKTHETLKVVNDQIGRPTWTRTLAEFMLYLVQTESKFGTYQLSNDNVCSWFEFANKILKNTHTKILPITSDEYPQKAYRPRHSIMSLDKARNINFKIPSWQDALDSFIKDIK
ncbi:RmlD substrate binding domain protein [Lentilactobacillus kisonensis F0435]|uniref:dTDP-4-dehydrorhamnose reductase n=2 Tax=Lentilactobacillus TaxID=2767893 RepID=H1LBQ3_9LACO|nr:RmlD substrate binding domain protein [Lentilactobacillus kisonensis F0435]